jgi:DNA-binding LytR/AlgR family response regulator
MDGIQMSKKLPDSTKVIFTTAFSHYAIEGFKVHALDYLLKPFNFEEFFAATKKAKDLILLLRQQNKPIRSGEFIFVKSEYKQVKIILEDVLYFEGLKDYVKIWLRDQPKPVLSLMSLKSLEEELPTSQFMRIHRSFIVNLNKIDSIERGQVLVAQERITIADQYKSKFQAFIDNRSLR